MSVRNLLISGTDDELWDWHIALAMFLNGIERREQTVMYTCLEEHYEGALEVAGKIGVTVQEWNGKEWAVIVEGKSGIRYAMPPRAEE